MMGVPLVAVATNEIDEIRKRMAEIRMELHEDVQGVVAGAEAAFDWQYYVRLYPWAALAGSVVVGYLIVPRKRHDREPASAVPHTPRSHKAAAKHEVQEEKQETRRKSGLVGLAMGFLGPIVMRAAQNYASGYVENWIQEQTFGRPVAGAAPSPSDGPSPPPYGSGSPGPFPGG